MRCRDRSVVGSRGRPYGRRMTRTPLIPLLAVALLAGCGSENSDRAGGAKPVEAKVLTMANANAELGELRGVRRGRRPRLRRPPAHQVAQRIRQGRGRQRGDQPDPRRERRQGRPRVGRDARLRRARRRRVQPVARADADRLLRARGEGPRRRARRPDAREPRRPRAPGHRRPARPDAPATRQASAARSRRLGRRAHQRERRRPGRAGAALARGEGPLRQPERERGHRHVRRDRDVDRSRARQPLPPRPAVSHGQRRPVAASAGALRRTGREPGRPRRAARGREGRHPGGDRPVALARERRAVGGLPFDAQGRLRVRRGRRRTARRVPPGV